LGNWVAIYLCGPISVSGPYLTDALMVSNAVRFLTDDLSILILRVVTAAREIERRSMCISTLSGKLGLSR
jgi:hypothetical protein